MANIKEVAKYADVSTSTVSRVLSGKDYVNEETRKKVLKVIKELEYSPNALAKGLKMGRSNTVAIMVPSIQNLIFPDIVRGIEDTLRKSNFTVVLCNTDEDMEVEKAYISKLRNRWIDGFIIASMMPDSDHIRQLHSEGVPVVLTGRSYDDTIDAVVIDNIQAAYNATRYLIRTGHKRIALVMGREELSIYGERYKGYIKALNEHDMPLDEELILRERNGSNSIYYLVKNMLAKGIVPDAIFATSDLKAIVAMRALRDEGYSIPRDISVMGFDNVSISAMLEPPLSTVSQPLYEIGVLAAKKLVSQIYYKETNGCLQPPTVDVMNTDLLIRQSTR